MFALIIQTILLFAIAFILGCVIGCLLRRLFGSADAHEEIPAIDSAVTTAAVAAPLRTPVVPAPPIPVAPLQPVEPAQVETPPAAFVQKPAVKETPAPVKPKPVARKPAKRASQPPAKQQTVAAAAKPDNLKLIRGIGPQNEGRLNSLGVNSFAQIASWSKKDQSHYGEVLSFPGRIEREEWVSQAKVLAKGGTTDFSKRVRQGVVKSSKGAAEPADLGTKPGGLLSEPNGGKGDNLTLIDGVGNALEKKLFGLGVYHFDQIAEMSVAELKWLGNSVGFPGRPERENWAGESKVLAAGGMTKHAKRVERGEIKTSRKS